MLSCDICGQDIENGDEYYKFPDGSTICTFDFCCLMDYGRKYLREADFPTGPDPDEQIEYHRDMKEEGYI